LGIAGGLPVKSGWSGFQDFRRKPFHEILMRIIRSARKPGPFKTGELIVTLVPTCLAAFAVEGCLHRLSDIPVARPVRKDYPIDFGLILTGCIGIDH
jgi:hypothetical protein